MGIFSSKYKTQVGTAVARVIEDNVLPDSIKTGLMKSIFANDDQIVENMMEEMHGSVGNLCHRMYDYGKNGYIYGLPKANIHNSQSGKLLVKNVIQTEVGSAINLDYYHFGPLNTLHVGWMALQDQHGYDPVTNQLMSLSTSKGVPVYLRNMVVVVAEATLDEMTNGSLDQWGTSPNSGINAQRKIINIQTPAPSVKGKFEIDPTTGQDYLRVLYDWIEETSQVITRTALDGTVTNETIVTKELKEDELILSINGYDQSADYHHVKYKIGNVSRYWLYKDGQGTYPGIDAIYFDTYDELGSFFPFAYFRYNKTSMGTNPDSEAFQSSEKLLNKINMDYAALVDSIHENPDIADVEQAMMMMAVPANTTNPIEQRYLFDFFKGLYVTSGGRNTNPSSNRMGLIKKYLEVDTPEVSAKSIIIQDARFKMNLAMRTITRHVVSGSIGPIGSYTSGRTTTTYTENGINTETGASQQVTFDEPSHFYRKQLTSHIYEEINVYGLNMTYYIFGEYTTTGDEEDDILLIPIDRSITDNYGIPDRETLYARSLHYVFNSRVVTKIKWYQRGIFKILMLVVSIVIMFYTYGATWQSFLAALANGTVTQAMVLAIVTQIVTALVVATAVKLFVKAVGFKAAFIVAVIAALAGAYIAIDAGSLTGAPWAQELLQLSTNLSSGVTDTLKDSFQGLLEEYKAFELFAEEKNKELLALQKLLETDTSLVPLLIFGEKPNDFYQRTVHSGNIGVMGIDAISSYVDVALTLPKLSDTI